MQEDRQPQGQAAPYRVAQPVRAEGGERRSGETHSATDEAIAPGFQSLISRLASEMCRAGRFDGDKQGLRAAGRSRIERPGGGDQAQSGETEAQKAHAGCVLLHRLALPWLVWSAACEPDMN